MKGKICFAPFRLIREAEDKEDNGTNDQGKSEELGNRGRQLLCKYLVCICV